MTGWFYMMGRVIQWLQITFDQINVQYGHTPSDKMSHQKLQTYFQKKTREGFFHKNTKNVYTFLTYFWQVSRANRIISIVFLKPPCGYLFQTHSYVCCYVFQAYIKHDKCIFFLTEHLESILKVTLFTSLFAGGLLYFLEH